MSTDEKTELDYVLDWVAAVDGWHDKETLEQILLVADSWRSEWTGGPPEENMLEAVFVTFGDKEFEFVPDDGWENYGMQPPTVESIKAARRLEINMAQAIALSLKGDPVDAYDHGWHDAMEKFADIMRERAAKWTPQKKS